MNNNPIILKSINVNSRHAIFYLHDKRIKVSYQIKGDTIGVTLMPDIPVSGNELSVITNLIKTEINKFKL